MVKDISVHLDGNDEDEPRIAFAEAVASTFDAFVAGIFINPLIEIRAMGGYEFGAVELEQLLGAARGRGERVEAELTARFARLSVANEVRHYDVLESEVRARLVEEARLFDLHIATRPYGEKGKGAELTEAVVFGSGRATLLVPPGGVDRFQFETIVVAWHNTRESARAVAEAMPFLTRARTVSVCMIGNDDLGGIAHAARGSDIARHLDRHGVAVQLNPVPKGRSVAETLLEEVSFAGAGLLVMGAYSHSRLRELMLGGVTRHVLSQASLPVLVAH